MPKRIQLCRTAGWRKPAGAVVVSRPTKWGNPLRWSDYNPLRFNEDGEQFRLTDAALRRFAVVDFRATVAFGIGRFEGYPSIEQIRAELAGKDLACWCPLGPCHADVLIEIANAPEDVVWARPLEELAQAALAGTL